MDDAWDWSDHIPSGGSDMIGYGYVTCSCGWDSDHKLGWVDHIKAMMRDPELEAALAPVYEEGCPDFPVGTVLRHHADGSHSIVPA